MVHFRFSSFIPDIHIGLYSVHSTLLDLKKERLNSIPCSTMKFTGWQAERLMFDSKSMIPRDIFAANEQGQGKEEYLQHIEKIQFFTIHVFFPRSLSALGKS